MLHQHSSPEGYPHVSYIDLRPGAVVVLRSVVDDIHYDTEVVITREPRRLRKHEDEAWSLESTYVDCIDPKEKEQNGFMLCDYNIVPLANGNRNPHVSAWLKAEAPTELEIPTKVAIAAAMPTERRGALQKHWIECFFGRFATQATQGVVS